MNKKQTRLLFAIAAAFLTWTIVLADNWSNSFRPDAKFFKQYGRYSGHKLPGDCGCEGSQALPSSKR